MTPLQRRIAGCTPLLDYGLDAVLRLLHIEESRDIPTAAIPVGGTPRLILNPDFVARACPYDEDLAALVLHELHHLLLGHTRLFPRVTTAHNIAFDAVINAMICRSRPHPRWTSLFRSLYAADRVPEALLRPPEGWPGRSVWPAALPDRARAVLEDLYNTGSGTFFDVFELLVRELPGLGAGCSAEGGGHPAEGGGGGGTPGDAESSPPTFVLGSHGDDVRGLEAGDDPGLFDAVRAIVEKWPQPPDPRVGRSMERILSEKRVSPQERERERVLRAALLAAARAGTRRVGVPEPRSVPADVAWPSRDRRAFSLAAAGSPPLLYQTDLPGRPRRTGRAPVDVYVDVSGSVNAFLPRLLGAVHACRAGVAPTVFQFSCGVESVTLDELRRGVVRTTSGTSGEAFAAHLAARGSRAAVVLTDGYVGAISAANAAACRRARLQVVLTPGGFRRDLQAAAAAFHTLDTP